jgi:membrane protease subunit HflK
MNDHDHQHDHQGHGHDHHGHDHDHDDPFHVHQTRELNVDEFDPANRSLAEALRISFGILKIVVAVLVVLLVVVGGYREVKEGQVGIKLRFGAPQGVWRTEGGEQVFSVEVLEPGAHFALPEPIDRVIIVPTRAQLLTIESRRIEAMNPDTGRPQVVMDTGFWFEDRPGDETKPLEEKTPRGAGLMPGRDGSLLTADNNIVHGKWSISYRIEDAATFARHVGSTDVTESLRRADRLVRQAAERAIVHVVATTGVEDFVQSKVDRLTIRQLANATLAEMTSGIVVNEVLLPTATPPLQVREAFAAVNNASSESKRRQEEARKDAEQTLTETAGRAHTALVKVIDYYEQAIREDDQPRIDKGRAAINALLSERTVGEALEPFADDARFDPAAYEKIISEVADATVGGEVSNRIKRAESDSTDLEAAVQAEKNAFLAQYEKFKNDPQLERIIRQRLWQDTVQEMLTGVTEVFYLPRDASRLYIVLGSNPEIRKMTETEARKRQLQEQE